MDGCEDGSIMEADWECTAKGTEVIVDRSYEVAGSIVLLINV